MLLLEAVEVGPGEMLLDLTTGLGHGAGLASHRGAIATGIDDVETLLDQARRRYPNALYYAGNSDSLVFANGFFAAVIQHAGASAVAAAETFAMISNSEVFRVLQPGGRCARLWLGAADIGAADIGAAEIGAAESLVSGQSAWSDEHLAELCKPWEAAGFARPQTRIGELCWQPVTASDRELLAESIDTASISTPITLVRWPALLLVATKPS